MLEQNLNTKNYPKQELIMEIFVLATDHDMNMHAKIQSMNMHIHFQKTYSNVLLGEFLYNALWSNKE
jgi:hypothetical protein